MIERLLKQSISDNLANNKAIVILGPRQVGKSTLLKDLFAEKPQTLWLNGDENDIVNLFENINADRLRAIIGKNTTLIIDEAQQIPDIGRKLKLITDQIPTIKLIVTGSSSFELANKLNEPLTGRKRQVNMFPLTFSEMVTHSSLLEEKRMINHRMLYGYYPEVVTNMGDERNVLNEIVNSYLYKDILRLDSIKKSEKLTKLLQALAHQTGSQVSYNEIGNLIGLDPKTVEKYIEVLEQCFVIFRLGSFARNQRNELKFAKKIYFWDLGVRNAIIGNFSQVENRQDTGALWENYVITERMKKHAYTTLFVNHYFWRTQQQKEIDLLEEQDGVLNAYEFKWNDNKKQIKVPNQFSSTYPDAKFQVVTPENIEDFLL